MLTEIFADKTLKPKQKVLQLGNQLLQKRLSVDELVAFAALAKDPVKASCIEALEIATAQEPALLKKRAFLFVTEQLRANAPRVKWESASVIANTARLFPSELDTAIKELLINSEHSGTVVRWSAAKALAAMLSLHTPHKKDLLPALESILAREEDNAIRKIYQAAIKKEKGKS
ncbi:MAG: hypothetical protein U0X40_05760 [Ferruginibacter sp.]